MIDYIHDWNIDGIFKAKDIIERTTITNHALLRIGERYDRVESKALKKFGFLISSMPFKRIPRHIVKGEKIYKIDSPNYRYVFSYKDGRFVIITFINKNIENDTRN